MATKKQLDLMYMNMALSMTRISNSKRTAVGAVGVTKNGVVITGVNGLPKELGNIMEYSGYGLIDLDEAIKFIEPEISCVDDSKLYLNVELPEFGLVTKPETIHAELNVILKSSRDGISLIGSTIYTTLSPCVHCASMLMAVGVVRIVYLNEYRITKGIDILKSCGMVVDKLEFEMVDYDS